MQTNRKLKRSHVELFLFILKEHFKRSDRIHRLDRNSRTGNSQFYEFIPCDLLKMLLFFKFMHSIKQRATWLRILCNMTMNCDLLKMLLFFKFIHSIKLRVTSLRISCDMTMNFGQRAKSKTIRRTSLGMHCLHTAWIHLLIACVAKKSRYLIYNHITSST